MFNKNLSISIPGIEKAAVRSIFSNDGCTLPVVANGINVGNIIIKRSVLKTKSYDAYFDGFSDYWTPNGPGVEISVYNTSILNIGNTLKKMVSKPDKPNFRETFGNAEDVSEYIKTMVKNNGDKNSEEVKNLIEKREDKFRLARLTDAAVSILCDKKDPERKADRYELIFRKDYEGNIDMGLQFMFDLYKNLGSYEKSNGKITSKDQLQSLIEKNKINIPAHISLNNEATNKKSKTTDDRGMGM